MKRIIIIILILSIVKIYSQNYTSPFNFPIYLSGTFGELRDNHFHAGIDIKTFEKEGYPVLSIADGYVSRIKISTWGYGKVIYINHKDGKTSVYAHLNRFSDKIEKEIRKKQYENELYEIEIFPKKDELTIKQGEEIGLSGNTGGSGGPHLHFEIRDTENELALNPLNFGFEVKDNLNPIISGIKIYSHNNASINNKISDINLSAKKCLTKETKKYTEYCLEETDLKINGEISFSINTFDRQDMSPNNKNGVYSIKLYVNNDLIHHFEMGKLSFEETRFINAHIDHEEYFDSNTRFNRCYRLPYNNLNNYLFEKYNGIINIKEGQKYNIKFEVQDIQKNLSVLNFSFNGSEKLNIQTKEKKPEIKYDKVKIFRNKNFECHLDKYSFYKDYDSLIYKINSKRKNTMSQIHTIMDESIPIHKNCIISIKKDSLITDKNNVFLAQIKKDSTFKYKGKTIRENYISALSKNLGSFCLLSDSISPTISNIKIDKDTNIYNGLGKIDVKIKDNESGISFYRGEINGKWILMEYDYKTDLLRYYFIPGEIPIGNNTIKIIVRDKLNNESIKEKDFIY